MKLIDYLVCREQLKRLYRLANKKGKKIILKELVRYESYKRI